MDEWSTLQHTIERADQREGNNGEPAQQAGQVIADSRRAF